MTLESNWPNHLEVITDSATYNHVTKIIAIRLCRRDANSTVGYILIFCNVTLAKSLPIVLLSE